MSIVIDFKTATTRPSDPFSPAPACAPNPLTAPATTENLQPGTRVRATFQDWEMGEVRIEGTVRRRSSATHLVVRICGLDCVVAAADCEVLADPVEAA